MFSRCRHAKGIKVSSALEAEFIALLMDMQQCWIRGYTKVIFEGDNMKTMDILNHRKLYFGMYNFIRKVRWWSKKFLEVEFEWIKKSGNEVAHKMAITNIPATKSFESYFYVSRFITSMLYNDYVNLIII